MLDTHTADVGDVVGVVLVDDLPLKNRRYADLTLLGPGVPK